MVDAMNQPTNEEILAWVTQHPDFERAKHVCPECHADYTGNEKIQAVGAPILEPPTWLRYKACGYAFGEREAATTEVVRIEAERRGLKSLR